ncbi:D-2-hydroxyacid dehydrogenase [Bacillus sp. SB49]|uniref:D-2-hydroxyacid dehydrogenase n=1 Tax=Bacillus sp. SB49 TaxID=1071080 RepID=UPI0003F7DE4E|nr:D-2-hydroxyacid dehydrogenase [Bacillus sp. SB49]QHT48005.1 D-2-hydroxyacid dehydrogenase [Bacillus sp. SB49]
MIVSTSDEWRESHVSCWKERYDEEVYIFNGIEEIPKEIRSRTDVLITFGNDLTAKNIHDFPSLKWIQLLSAGLEDLPFEELRKKGLYITNAKGVHSIPMKEYVIGAMLHFEKHFHRFLKQKEERVWERETLVGELIGRKVLLFGTGTIGTEIAKASSYFGMRVDGVNTRGREVDAFHHVYGLEEGLDKIGEYDYVISVLPLTASTKNVFSKERLATLATDSVFMNLGRGAVLDEEALVHMLKTGRLKGAVLDVFIQEPLPRDHSLWEVPNLLLTPHMSAKSNHYMTRCMDILLENYQRYRSNDPANMKNLIDISRNY